MVVFNFIGLVRRSCLIKLYNFASFSNHQPTILVNIDGIANITFGRAPLERNCPSRPLFVVRCSLFIFLQAFSFHDDQTRTSSMHSFARHSCHSVPHSRFLFTTFRNSASRYAISQSSNVFSPFFFHSFSQVSQPACRIIELNYHSFNPLSSSNRYYFTQFV